jgi:serine/threonine-protein kinase
LKPGFDDQTPQDDGPLDGANPRVTTTLGRYRLEHRLGEGGMGDVYAAVVLDGDDRGQRVCVKVMKPTLAMNPRAVELFLREARHASRLRHENIVRILELGKDGGTWFLAMELLDGLPWHDIGQRFWLHGLVLPLEVIVGAAADAALALQYAHTLRDRDGRPMGLVHRDISPDNLFLTRDGSTRVLDFGIAKATTPDATSLTEMGELRGKLPYMPPEQVRTNTVDGAADIWALGVTMFFLSTAQRPFDRSNPVAMMKAIEHEPAISVIEMNPTLPPSFAAVVARCLQKHPAARWPSAQALREALLALLPEPPRPDEAQALLLRARALAPGERRPMTAYAAGPAWPSWSSPRRPAKTFPDDDVATVRMTAPSRGDAARTATARAGEPQHASWDDATNAETMRRGRGERTVVTAPLVTADDSAFDSVVEGAFDSVLDGARGGADDSGFGSAEDFDDGRTIADQAIPAAARAAIRSTSQATALQAEQTVRLTVYPSSHGSALSDGTMTVALPDAAAARAAAAGTRAKKNPGVPVWAYGVAAFVLTVLLAVVVVAVVYLVR